MPRRAAIPEPNSPADWVFNDYIFRSPDNIRLICRREHHQRNMIEQREDRLLFPVPTLEFMLRTLRQNLQDGLIHTTTDKMTAELRTPEAILRDVRAVEAIDEAELLQRAAYHILEAQKSA